MTHLGNALNRLMLERPDLTGKGVSEEAGIDPSYLSKLRRGLMPHIDPKFVLRIANAIGRTAAERAEIIAAHMKDESCGYYPGWIRLTIRDKESDAASELDPEIAYLQKHLGDSKIRNAVRSIVALHRESGNKRGNTK